MSSFSNCHSNNRFLKLSDGTELPFDIQPSPLNLIVGHGLGDDPASKSHHDDISTDIVKDMLVLLSPFSSLKEERQQKSAVFYTARGHGNSRGWESSTLSSFYWPNLGDDMYQVAKATNIIVGGHSTDDGKINQKFVAIGNSMGAASALYMTIKYPQNISALVLMRPPRAWEERRRVASSYFKNEAKEMQVRNPGTFHHLPLLGATETDLPPVDDDGYASIKCPVLIMCHGNDSAHPISTGETLNELMVNTQLEIAEEEEEAKQVWPGVIASWLKANGLVERG